MYYLTRAAFKVLKLYYRFRIWNANRIHRRIWRTNERQVSYFRKKGLI